MASEEDKSQKTEEPTEHKLNEERKKGNIPRSKEVNNFVMLIAVTLAVALLMPQMSVEMLNMMGSFLQDSGKMSLAGEDARFMFKEVTRSFFLMMLPFFILFIFCALAAGFGQSKFLFSVEQMKPKLSKISVIKGFGRLFSKQSFVEFLKSFFKMIVLAVIMYAILVIEADNFYSLSLVDMFGSLTYVHQMVIRLLIASIIFMAILAIIDYIFQQADFKERNKMSLYELKQEYKNTQGDPQVKGRQKQLRMERARARMMEEVPKADVVVTNPTHFAVALKYSQEEGAPKVVAKGADHVAFKIRQTAKEHDVPVLEDPPLARALYKDCELDSFIPVQLYEAVAQVIRYVMDIKNGMNREFKGSGYKEEQTDKEA